MASAEFEPAIPLIKQFQTYASDRTATEIGLRHWTIHLIYDNPPLLPGRYCRLIKSGN